MPLLVGCRLTASSGLLAPALPPPSQGISGGQARRLTIGVEIMHMSEVGRYQAAAPQSAVPPSFGPPYEELMAVIHVACLLAALALQVIFLDEPTTGLDSTTSYEVSFMSFCFIVTVM